MQADGKLLCSLTRWKRDKVLVHIDNISFLFASENFRWDICLQKTCDKIKESTLFNICTVASRHKPLFTHIKPKRQKEVTGDENSALICHTALHPCIFLLWQECKIPHLKPALCYSFTLTVSLSLSMRLFLPLLFSFFSSSSLLYTYSSCLNLLRCQYPALN